MSERHYYGLLSITGDRHDYNDLTNLIDGYGANRAKAAEDRNREKRIEKALADLDPGSNQGEFRLTITDLVIEGDDEDLKAKSKRS